MPGAGPVAALVQGPLDCHNPAAQVAFQQLLRLGFHAGHNIAPAPASDRDAALPPDRSAPGEVRRAALHEGPDALLEIGAAEHLAEFLEILADGGAQIA